MTAPRRDADAEPLHIVCLSHLVWENQLFQRPQQLMSCFSRLGDGVHYFALTGFRRYMTMRLAERSIQTRSGLRALNLPFVPLAHRFKPLGKATMLQVRVKARGALRMAPPGRRVLWLQNPSFVEEIDHLHHDLLVYDLMDPHAAFKKAGSKVASSEEQLFDRADIVFTGGRSLHQRVEGRHPNAYCFPSGIDFRHFARGAEEGPVADDIARIRRPILGYFGSVDERIDWDLVSHLCRERRHWSIVFLGPLNTLTDIPISEKNFHWLGPKPYQRLPEYLRAFDVCLIPWLVNDLTRFMSPTKTPEYLAAGRPVVSVPIPDVEADYRDEVLVADTPQRFVEACTAALNQGIGPAHKPPQSRTWPEIARDMRRLMIAALEARAAHAPEASSRA